VSWKLLGPPRPSSDAEGRRAPRLAASSASRVGLLALSILGSSCAYYNTFYLAKRYYNTATEGLPYAIEKATGAQTGNYQKAIDYSKKVIANYPKSKWVDDAYLMWAQSLLGKEDPLQTITMLQDFPTRYPDSPLKPEATFYLGVAFRQARKYTEALVSLDEYLEKAPNGSLVTYAQLERSRALMSLNRPKESAEAASQVIERFPNNPLVVRLRAARAEALLTAGDPTGARRDFQALGLRSVDDNERFGFLLREADCLEAARDYAGGLELLTAALSNEPAPVRSATGTTTSTPAGDRYGQLTLRIGTLHLLAGRSEQALEAYRNVLQDYPKTGLAAEAQYRIGYTQETVFDNFDAARQEYAKVRDQSASSPFFAQATERQQSLDRLARFRSAGADSSERKVEAGFLLAEQYLFQLDKPDRAIDAYAEIAREHPGTPIAAKAMNAEAWVLRRKLERPRAADSLLWKVVREYPGTEAQLAARDYLETGGHVVPTELIKLPEPKVTAPDTTLDLTPPPQGPMPIGPPRSPGRQLPPQSSDSLGANARDFELGRRPSVGGPGTGITGPAAPSVPDSLRGRAPDPTPSPRALSPFEGPGPALRDTSSRAVVDGTRRAVVDTTHRPATEVAPRAVTDSTRQAAPGMRRVPQDFTRRALADSIRRAEATRRAPADTTRRAPADATRRAPADTTRRAPADTTRRAPPDTTRRRWMPTDTLRWAPR